MGNIESIHPHGNLFPQKNHQINEDEFRVIPNYSYTHQADPYYSSNFQVLSDKLKPQLQIEKYQLFFNTEEEYNTYQEIYHWRNQYKYLVQGRALKQRSSNRICGSFHQATLFLERIPIRACEITDVPIQEGLYLLYTSFLAFRKIFQRTGYFDIALDMICINKEALVKIWLNPNLSKIYPQFYSISQNFSETDFINKLLQVCEPLIDYTPIQEKFSDFLKGCYFSSDQIPKKVNENKFCKDSRFTEVLNRNFGKTQLSHNFKLLSFDKIINFFEGYLNKHNLVIARQMKSIRDLFKVQPRIECKSPLSQSKLKVSTEESKQQLIEKLYFMPLSEQMKRKKLRTKRKNTNRTNTILLTDRSNTDHVEALFSYKSEEYVKNIRELKEPQFILKQPSIPFRCAPITTFRSYHPQVYSPEHAASTRRYIEGRERIKTAITPNITFSIRPQRNYIQSNLSPSNRDKPTERLLCKNQQREVQPKFTDGSKMKSNAQEKPNILENNVQNNQGRELRKISSELKIESNIFSKRQTPKAKDGMDKKKIVFFAAHEQLIIDEEIAKDLDLFEKSQSYF